MTHLFRIGLVLLVCATGCDLLTYDVYRQARDGIAVADDDAPDGGDEPTPARPDVDEVVIASGSFLQGCRSWLDTSCEADELPAREVVLGSFAIDRRETMRIAYQACVHAGACVAPSCEFDPVENPTKPVVCVTWDQAATFCAWTGRRLPTEAEWERAAHGAEVVYPWGDDAPACGRTPFAGCNALLAETGMHGVDTTIDGVVDLAGNAREWVADWYDAQSYATDTTADPRGPGTGELRIVRGGGVDDAATEQRGSARTGFVPTVFTTSLGFRCARSLPPGG